MTYTLKQRHGKYDECQTPAYALPPLLPYLSRDEVIWECAAGEALLAVALAKLGYFVFASDILFGNDFFEFQPVTWNVIVTNPPYSMKYAWLERCYDLGKPFALLMPVEMLGAKTAQRMFDKYGIEIIFLDRRVNFKMPYAGWNSRAQFSTAWFTYGLNIGKEMTFAQIYAQ